MIMIVKTPGSQMGSPAAAEEGGEEVGGGRWESGERREVQARSTLTSTAPTARSRSGEVATLDEVPRISLRVSSKLPSSPSSLLSSQRSHGHRHAMKRDRKVCYKTTTNVRVPMDCNFFRSSVGGT